MSEEAPTLIGMDYAGDLVWQLPNGRWTWGESAMEAMTRPRTFQPARYIEKYGAPTPLPGAGSLAEDASRRL